METYALPIVLGACVGIVTGLLGGGGGILCVPLLIYGLGLEEKAANQASLAVVGLAAIVGCATHARAGNVEPRAALLVGGVGAVASFAGAQVSQYVPGDFQRALFGLLVLVASAYTLGPLGEKDDELTDVRRPIKRGRVLLGGAGAGFLTGVLGVGGGFIIVPVLASAGVPIRRAIGTSLLVIAINTLGGFIGYSTYMKIEDQRVYAFGGAAIVTAIAAAFVSRRVPRARLRFGFGVMLVVLAVSILIRELVRHIGGR